MTTLKTTIFALLVFATFGCGPDAQVPKPHGDDGRQEISASFDTPTDNSLYALGASWTDQRGINMQLGELQGRPVMMAMVFTNCRYACPIIVHDMKRIEREIPQDLAEGIQFVLVSLDPERDDAEALARFGRAYGLDEDQWTLLKGAPNDVRMLATALGVKYKKEEDGQFSHTNMVAVLNAKGELLHREMNPGGASSSMIAALRRGTTSSSL